jgi:histone deacetylase complex regulatory component SIN3
MKTNQPFLTQKKEERAPNVMCPTVIEAQRYLQQVRDRLASQKDVYKTFIVVMRKYKDGE